MSKDIIVLTPNGRRQKIHCTPDTSMLQVLEDVCSKQGFQPSDYDLKHHNHLLDLTTTVRFSNLPNKATLEMVEAEKKREETAVTIGLLLEDGERRTADFSPNTSLYDLITSLAATELSSFTQPTILYMRQEVIGIAALKHKTLRQLGLIGGRAILRLLNKAEETTQANVSAIYHRPISENVVKDSKTTDGDVPKPNLDDHAIAGPSNVQGTKPKIFDSIEFIKKQKSAGEEFEQREVEEKVSLEESKHESNNSKKVKFTESSPTLSEVTSSESSSSFTTKEDLERRLRIEEEVTFIGSQKAIAFMQPDVSVDELEDLPDDFYDLSIEEVRRLYHDLQNQRLQLENTPLMTSGKKDDINKQVSQRTLNTYKNVVVRIQFPDHIILQGVFIPSNTIEDVTNFVKEHLQNKNAPFHIFTTPLKEILDPKMTLLEARFVPCVHMHFKWLNEDRAGACLKNDICNKLTSSDGARILASKYRAPSRRIIDDEANVSQAAGSASTSKYKVPKWFKK